MKEHYAYGEICVAFRRAWELTHTTRQGWIQSFLDEQFDGHSVDTYAARAAWKEVRPATRLVDRRCKIEAGRKGVARPAMSALTVLGRRRRAFGGGRKPVNPALNDELWAWFVDFIYNVPGRIGSSTILDWARIICQDLKELWQRRVEAGDADVAAPPKLPQLSHMFVVRWRRAYGISWRTVNLRYKLSAAKRKHRLRVFWCNVLRMRFLHERLFGEGKLRFVGFDQKPLYFNSCAAKKTLAMQGARKVAVKENLAKSRERFTVMTSVPSWCPNESDLGWTTRYGNAAPMIAVLFKSPTADARRIRSKLMPTADCLLQFAEKGSYRLRNVVVFLDWFLQTDPRRVADSPAARAATGGVVRVAAGGAARAAPGGAPAAEVAAAADDAFGPDDGVVSRDAAGGVARAAAGGAARAAPGATPAAEVAAASDDDFGSDDGVVSGDAAGGVARASRSDWKAKMKADGSNTVVIVLDWFAPHLDEAVDNLVHDACASVLRIGGGITGDVQVGDTHRHGPYTAAYREIETHENNQQLRLRPWKLPDCSRQMVLDRAVNAWSDVPHLQCEREWKQDGVLNALDGSEDGMLTEDLFALWSELQMSKWREQIKHDIDVEVSSGNLTSWWEYPHILENYDDHRPLREGEEMAEIEIAEDGPDDDDDDGSDSENDASDGDLASHVPSDPAMHSCASSSAATSSGNPTGSSVRSEKGASCPILSDVGKSGASCSILSDAAQERAEGSLREDARIERMQALSDAAEILRKGGDVSMAQACETRLLNLQKKKLQASEEERLFLRSKTLERRDARVVAQAGAAKEDKRLRLLKEEAKIAQAKAQEEKGKSRVEARKLEESTRQAARAANERRNATKLHLDLCRRHWVAYALRRWEAFFIDATLGAQRRDNVVKQVKAALKRKAQWPMPPDPWTVTKKTGYVSIAPLTPIGEKVKRMPNEIASQPLAKLLYGGRHPSAATTCESVASRATKLASRCMPQYNDLFVGFHGIAQLFAKHKNNLDLAFFEAMWLYSYCAGATLQPELRSWPPSDVELERFVAQCNSDGAPVSTPAPSKHSAPSSSSSGVPLAKKMRHDVSTLTWT